MTHRECFNGRDYFLEHGDCSELMRTLESGCFDCIVTDPSYGVNFSNDFYDDSKDSVMTNMDGWYSEFYRLLKDDCYLFLFCGVKGIEEWILNGKKNGFTFKNVIATRAFNNARKVKNNFSFTFQPVLLFSKGEGKPFNTVDLFPTSEAWMKDKRNIKHEAYNYQYPNFIPSEIAYGTETYGSLTNKEIYHPNAKNEKLIKFFIELATDKGDIVFDPFMGSCTTGAACVNCGRSFAGCEMDDKYFEMSLKRIRSLTDGRLPLS